MNNTTEIAHDLGLLTIPNGILLRPQDIMQTAPSKLVAIASGIYELFGDNERVLASLNGIARAMPHSPGSDSESECSSRRATRRPDLGDQGPYSQRDG